MTAKKRIQYEWSISIYKGDSPDQMRPAETVQIPTLTAEHVTDADAGFVADPFMISRDGRWYMFYEVLNQENGLGEIACSSSPDLINWNYEGISLVEPFHLSYPMVFKSDGVLYMVPETRQAGEIRLYEALDFPKKWKQVAVLAEGDYADATPFKHNGTWWMYALHGTKTLHLYAAENLKGPWTLHPSSPLVENDLRVSRPAGRVIQYDGKLFRLAQDGIPLYGSRVRMMEVLTLDKTQYQEIEIDSSPILKGSRKGWNAIAMHHMDAQQTADGSWIACVDGATPKFDLPSHKTHAVDAHAKYSKPSKGSICFVAGEFAPTIGGLSKSATRIASLLAADGYDLHVVVPTTGKPSAALPKPEQVQGMNIYRVPIGEELKQSGGIALTACIWQLDQIHQFSLFHGFFLPMAYVCLMAVRNIERPLMASIRGSDADMWTAPDKIDITHKILEYTTCLTTVNTSLTDKITNLVNYSGRTEFIKNSIPSAPLSWSLGNHNRGVVGTIGKFQAKKCIPLLVDAYAQLDAELRRQLVLVGGCIEQTLDEEINKAIRAQGVLGEVKRSDFIPPTEVHKQLQEFHCFVLTSSSEGFPNSILEAAAVGLPIVTTEFPGVHDYLEHMENAIIVPVNDKTALAAAINLLLSDDELAYKLSVGAKELATSLSPENEAKQWLELHEELLKPQKAEVLA